MREEIEHLNTLLRGVRQDAAAAKLAISSFSLAHASYWWHAGILRERVRTRRMLC